jgi:hypothetical protein
VPHWHPNQLRHSFGTLAREQHGLEAAQHLLGHSRSDVTERYARTAASIAAAVAVKSADTQRKSVWWNWNMVQFHQGQHRVLVQPELEFPRRSIVTMGGVDRLMDSVALGSAVVSGLCASFGERVVGVRGPLRVCGRVRRGWRHGVRQGRRVG